MSTRQTQHRPEREAVKGRELAEARKEVRQLKRLVSRLQKTIRKLENERGVAAEIEEASPEPLMAEPRPAEGPTGGACHCGATNWASLTTPGGKVIRACRNCKARC